MHSPSHWVAMGIVSQPPEGEETGFFFFSFNIYFSFFKRQKSALTQGGKHAKSHGGEKESPVIPPCKE